MKLKLQKMQCPCDSKKLYALCCGRYHKGKIHAPTAEALMRSRFSAYVLDNAQYVYRTWDENTRPPLAVLREDSSQVFTQLEIINTTKGGIEDESGTVEFIASYTINDNGADAGCDKSIHQHHENSTFKKQKNRWFYVKSH